MGHTRDGGMVEGDEHPSFEDAQLTESVCCAAPTMLKQHVEEDRLYEVVCSVCNKRLYTHRLMDVMGALTVRSGLR